jgi:hypothetical protein
MLKEPGEFHGLALWEGEYDVTLHRVRENDGKYYSVREFRIDDDETTTVADALSVLGIERTHEQSDRKGLQAVSSND